MCKPTSSKAALSNAMVINLQNTSSCQEKAIDANKIASKDGGGEKAKSKTNKGGGKARFIYAFVYNL